MDITMLQEHVQQQNLILTTQMQYSLNILQMSIEDLQQDINKALVDNPLLEIIDKVDSSQKHLDDNTPYEDSLQYNNPKISESLYADPYNNFIEKQTLKEYLKDQLLLIHASNKTVFICNYIIENIDKRGYLSCPLEEISSCLNIPLSDIQSALTIIQTFEPNGVGARNLKECLHLQLSKNGITNEIPFSLVEKHLEDIAENRIKEVSALYKLTQKETQNYFNYIKSLEPKPSRGFFSVDLNPLIIPEAYIQKTGEDINISINNQVLPKLTVNQLYTNALYNKQNHQIAPYIKTKLNSALFYIKCIEHRHTTIYNIIIEIVDIQKDYFTKGELFLKPMTLSQISSKLDISESTVSRAIKDKYISTPYGTILIKKLFASGVKSINNTQDMISSKYVKTLISNILEDENPYNPFSDQLICTLLRERDIHISRRTVSKYREEMNIKCSSKRKIYK